MAKSSTLNDDAWQKICERTKLLEEVRDKGFFFISADELKRHSEFREPRLLAKLDTDEDRPKIFRKHGLNVLPLKRGFYVVFKDPENVCYLKLPNPYEPNSRVSYRPKLDLAEFDLLQQNCTSESMAIEIAFLSSLLSTFSKTSNLMRMRTGRIVSKKFEIKLPSSDNCIEIDKSQMEVDGIFESADTIVLVEAKIAFRTNINIRQIHYPYVWLREQSRKRIVPILLCYSNDVFQLTEFVIGDHFGQITVKRQEFFVLEKDAVLSANFEEICSGLQLVEEPVSIPYPQADDLDKVIDVLRLTQQAVVSNEAIAQRLGFEPRQAAYYQSAAAYLGVVEKSRQLTKRGKALLAESRRSIRTKLILESMVQIPSIREAITLFLKRKRNIKALPTTELEKIIDKWRPGEFSETTLRRRAQTIRNWLRWISVNCDL